MMMKNSLSNFTGKEALYFLILTLVFFIIAEKAAIFRFEPAGYREIFHSTAALILSLFFFLYAFIQSVILIRHSRGIIRLGGLFFQFAIILLCTSLWVSNYSRFEGKFVRMQGQTFNGFKKDYLPQTVYLGKKAKFAHMGVTIKKITPYPASTVNKLDKVTADIIYQSRTSKGLVYKTFSSKMPFFTDWSFVSISDFGYAPRYVLLDNEEKEVESNYLYKKLYPPGKEDSFEFYFLGYVLYLQCFPDFVDVDGKAASKSAELKKPVFNLRIARNKDIVYNGLIRTDEKIRFDNIRMAFPEVRYWIEVSIVRDFGLPVLAVAFLFLLVGVVLLWIDGRRKRSCEISGEID
ncbi:MAG: hypothetical protein OEV42_20430 [Deltaproteobacteria bacterium]|nr:hypothetical protein [Deltaproteobacteria bacterium]